MELREHMEKKAGLSQEKLQQALAAKAAETEENRSRKAAEIRAKLEVLHRNRCLSHPPDVDFLASCVSDKTRKWISAPFQIASPKVLRAPSGQPAQ